MGDLTAHLVLQSKLWITSFLLTRKLSPHYIGDHHRSFYVSFYFHLPFPRVSALCLILRGKEEKMKQQDSQTWKLGCDNVIDIT